MYSNNLHDEIFKDFIHSTKLDVDCDILKCAAKVFQGHREGVQKSNRGGYQSTMVCGGSTDNAEIDEVVNSCEYYIDMFLDEHFGVLKKRMGWWLNINSPGDFNVPHNHGKCDVTALFYISAPSQSGCLRLERNDGSSYSSLYDKVPGGMGFTVEPEDGRLYIFPGHIWHWVESNLSSKERISISFNINLQE